MKVKLFLMMALFFIVLTLVLNIGRIGNTDLFFQVSQAQTKLLVNKDLVNESVSLIANNLYRKPSTLYDPISPSGAKGANIIWENGQSRKLYIEEQRYGEERIAGGIIKNNLEAIESGFKMFDWGFNRQASDGSFIGTADAFHSTSFFVQAVARSLLLIQQSPLSNKYRDKVEYYKPLLHRAARWMISPNIWSTGIKKNLPYTHRRYLVASALGLTGKLTGDRQLIEVARRYILDGISLQQTDGVNPENGGSDSSYQMVGLVYAQRWATQLYSDPATPAVINMINKGLAWEKGKILSTGEISVEGNTRTGLGKEVGRSGEAKLVSQRSVLRGFAYWASATGDKNLENLARKVADFYYK